MFGNLTEAPDKPLKCSEAPPKQRLGFRKVILSFWQSVGPSEKFKSENDASDALLKNSKAPPELR